MHITLSPQQVLRTAATIAAGTLLSFAFAHSQTKTLSPNSRFFVPEPPQGVVQQVEGLVKQGQLKNALLLTAMETVPQAVWLSGGTPAAASSTVETSLRQASLSKRSKVSPRNRARSGDSNCR